MISVAIDAVTAEHIRSLVENDVRESRTIEYKQALPGGRDTDKREFLADVSSMANAAGGDLIYGVAAVEGVPTNIVGLPGFSPDSDWLRLESILRDGVDPRIPGVSMQDVDIPGADPVLVVRVPKSWSGPHMVTLGGASRFYARGGAGKFQMDTTELRSAFALAEDLPERIRRWRDDRIAKLLAGVTPIPLAEEAKFVLHLIPLDSFAHPARLEPGSLVDGTVDFQPIHSMSSNRRINLDGLLTHDGNSGRGEFREAHSYCQVFRSGRIEAVCEWLANEDQEGRVRIASIAYEKDVLEATAQYLRSLASLGVTYPIVVLLSLLGAKGGYMSTDGYRHSAVERHTIDQDVVLLPDILLEDSPTDLPRAMRPMFDALWNACGMPQSRNFDAKGNWRSDPLHHVPTQVLE